VELARYIEALQSDLAGIAAVGDEQTAAAAGRLIEAIRASAGLRLLDVLTEATLELSGQLPSGHVEVRLSGQDPSLVYVEEEETEAAPVAGDEGSIARISLRLPEGLKASVEAAAAREGVSVNTWLIRALTRSVSGGTQRSGKRLTGFAKS
jgi:HicB family